MATAEFSKFAGIFSEALSLHHLLGFEIDSPPLALFIVMLPKAHLTLHSRMSTSSWVITRSWLSEEALQIPVERREAKGKGEKKRKDIPI